MHGVNHSQLDHDPMCHLRAVIDRWLSLVMPAWREDASELGVTDIGRSRTSRETADRNVVALMRRDMSDHIHCRAVPAALKKGSGGETGRTRPQSEEERSDCLTEPKFCTAFA
jgi:hypothetical protein